MATYQYYEKNRYERLDKLWIAIKRDVDEIMFEEEENLIRTTGHLNF